jgi:hypothetical protein
MYWQNLKIFITKVSTINDRTIATTNIREIISITWERQKDTKVKYVQYRLNGRHDGGNDEHGGERDHDTIGEVVHREVEGEIANANQYKSLKL